MPRFTWDWWNGAGWPQQPMHSSAVASVLKCVCPASAFAPGSARVDGWEDVLVYALRSNDSWPLLWLKTTAESQLLKQFLLNTCP